MIKKKLKNKKIPAVLLVILLTISSSSTVNAASYYTFNDHTMIGGVGGSGTKYYWVKSYTKKSNAAMKDWVYTTSRLNYSTSLSFKSTSDRANSVIDIMSTSSRGSHSKNVLAWTEFYKSGSSITPSENNWKYCYIKLYKPTFKSLSSSGKKGTIAHEMGHAFGLAHNNSNPNSIMCQTGSGRRVSSAQICDLKGINHLY